MLRDGGRRSRFAIVEAGTSLGERVRSSRFARSIDDLLGRLGSLGPGRGDADHVDRSGPQPAALQLEDFVLRLVDGRIVPAAPQHRGESDIDVPTPDGVPPMGGAPLRPEPNGGVDEDDDDSGVGARRSGLPEGFLFGMAIATLVPLAVLVIALASR